eukprot:scaffold278207_cov28-Tisochrysis_lutea.AAC.3
MIAILGLSPRAGASSFDSLKAGPECSSGSTDGAGDAGRVARPLGCKRERKRTARHFLDDFDDLKDSIWRAVADVVV